MFKSVINTFSLISRKFHNKPKYQLRHITPEQLDRMPYYQDKWLAIAQNPTENDFKTVKRAIDNAYQSIGLLPPKVRRFRSPGNLRDTFNQHQDAHTHLESLIIFFAKFNIFAILIWLVFSIIFVPFSVFTATLDILAWINFELEFYSVIFLLCAITCIVAFQYKDSNRLPQLIRRLFHLSLNLLYYYLLLIAPLVNYFQNHLNPLYSIAYASGWLFIFLWTPIGNSWIVAQWKRRLESSIRSDLHPKVWSQLDQAFDTDWLAPWNIVGNMVANANSSGELHTLPGKQIDSETYLNVWAWINWCSRIDFCISELGCTCDPKLWNSLHVLIQSCSTVLPRRKFCYISDRPTQIHFDEQQRLHGVGQPAISFADDTHLYFNQGVHLPSDYGKLHPHQWHSEWVLTEANAEVRRILIEGIGYGRVCQELNARTIDTWREYTLLWIELPTLIHANNRQVTEEPIFLLKMTCPSTKHIHALRVPPNIGSARTAAKWVNWDIDPERFIIET
jgi:hypothetical protein